MPSYRARPKTGRRNALLLKVRISVVYLALLNVLVDQLIFLLLIGQFYIVLLYSLDPFAVKRNVARTLNSQQMFEYILHCLKTTYKHFALPLNTAPANHKLGGPKPSNHKPEKGSGSSLEVGLGPLSDEQGLPSSLDSLSLAESARGHKGESGSQDSNCVVEEEEEVGEGYSESDKDKERESADLGNSSLSEEEEEEEEVYSREHLNSFTTEDEELFQLDEVSGDEPLSDEEGPCQEEDEIGRASCRERV